MHLKTEQGVNRRPASAPPGPGRQAAALLCFLAVSHGVSFVASLVIIENAGGWYAAADKAPWTPPGWAFGAVWTVLYTTMAVAAWLVWRRGAGLPSGSSRGAMTVYGVLLLVNLAWAPLFFGMYPMFGSAALWLALLIIAAHAVAAAATVVRFGLISRAAGLLMLPYVSWIVFSLTLNAYAAASN
ncbi:TspO and MBR related proteins [Arthrobacter sp. ov407]|uniref:TspO/MBR family protein n=1 Tax=Arthrobacter sp. ov407 TaxID=1761748 RepID=UPI00088B1051|nr:TspO and MBR related proteins [Arthrobacter sp. ov407]